MDRGGRSRRRKTNQDQIKQLEMTDEGDVSDATSGGEPEHNMEAQTVDLLRSGLKNIIKEIKD